MPGSQIQLLLCNPTLVCIIFVALLPLCTYTLKAGKSEVSLLHKMSK